MSCRCDTFESPATHFLSRTDATASVHVQHEFRIVIVAAGTRGDIEPLISCVAPFEVPHVFVPEDMCGECQRHSLVYMPARMCSFTHRRLCSLQYAQYIMHICTCSLLPKLSSGRCPSRQRWQPPVAAMVAHRLCAADCSFALSRFPTRAATTPGDFQHVCA